jgi:hypothetical protein
MASQNDVIALIPSRQKDLEGKKAHEPDAVLGRQVCLFVCAL